MKKLSLTLFCCLLAAMAAWAQSQYDAMAPFGFAARTSRTDASTSSVYNITGGGAMTYEEALESSSKIVLTSDGTTAMDDIIKNVIKNYSVIIFDGSNNTDFWLNQYIAFDGLKNKTLIGVNGARLCTQFYLTSEMHQMLNNYQWTTTTGTQKTGVKAGSTSSGSNKFGNLPNGQSVSEESEYLTRKALIEYLSDNDENFRKAGVFQFKRCENFIIRNLKFVGPGPCDVGGYDLMSMTESSHFWVDHCEFTDGIDGNFDITNNSDFSTISWCTFAYTERAYAHMNTNLVGSSDTDGMLNGNGYYLNLTWAYNHWGNKCDQRMPMARAGKIHMLNNYYTCKNNSSSINPRANSEFYIEGNYFADGVAKVFSQSGAKAYQWISSGSRTNVIASSGVSTPSSSGTVNIPYSYDNTLAAANVPTEVGKWAGATLFVSSEKNTDITATVDGKEASFSNDSYTYSFDAPDAKTDYTVVLTLPTGATVSAVTGATLESGTTYNIIAPEEGSTVSATFTITSADGTVNRTYTIVLKSISNVRYADVKTSGNTTIYYWNSNSGSTTKSDFKVLTGSYKIYSSGSEISYSSNTYKYGLKMETSTEAQLNISEKSNVTFVFDATSKRFYLNGTTCTTNSNGVYTQELARGVYTIKKQDSPNLVAIYVTPSNPVTTLYKVTYDANVYGSCSTTNWTQSSEGQSTTLPSVTANTGYRFMGWATSSVAVIAEYNAGASYTPTSDVTLYAVYQQEQQGGGKDGDVVTLFSWESTNNTTGGVIVTGGTATGNLAASNNIYAMKLADKPSSLSNGNHVIVTLSNGNTFAEGDVITVTGFYSKSSASETSFGVVPGAESTGDHSSGAILGTETDWPNNNGVNYDASGFTLVTHSYTLTSSFNDQVAITLTRGSKSGTSLCLTKVEVTREVPSLPATVTATVAATRKFGSFSSLYNVDYGDDEYAAVRAYTVKVKDATSVVLTRHFGVLPAGEGVVLYAPDATKSQTFNVVGGSYGKLMNNDMIGVPVARTVEVYVDGKQAYAVNSDMLKPLSATGTIPAGKAYILLPMSSNAKVVSMVFDEQVTGISDNIFINTNPTVGMKIYNLQGIEVKNPVRGHIYIINNKKCVFK